MPEPTTRGAESRATASGVRDGDRAVFGRLVERHRHELRAHCERMLRDHAEAEDAVQETFLRAWRHRDQFEGRASPRTWLYRIATNACLDRLRRRRPLPSDWTDARMHPARGERAPDGPHGDVVAPATPSGGPEHVAVANETIERAYLAAIRHLPPGARAALVLRDLLGCSAHDTALLLGGSVAAANSAVQRARATLRDLAGDDRLEWPPSASTTEERRRVERCMVAHRTEDAGTMVRLLLDADLPGGERSVV